MSSEDMATRQSHTEKERVYSTRGHCGPVLAGVGCPRYYQTKRWNQHGSLRVIGAMALVFHHNQPGILKGIARREDIALSLACA